MKKFILLLSYCFISSLAFAQNALPYLYGSHNNLQTSRFHPSLLGDSPFNGQINIFNVYLFGGTNAFSYRDFKKIADRSVNNSEVDAMLAKLDERNQVSVGSYLSIPFTNFAFKIQRKDENGNKTERFSLGFFSGLRAESNVSFDKVLADFAWKGNKQFIGQSVDVGKISANALIQAEAGAGVAIPFRLNDNLSLRTGIRAKYIWGFANANTRKASGVITTTDNGVNTEIKADLDYELNTSFPESDNSSVAIVGGRGFGIDLGGSLFIGKRFVATLSVIDIGAVNYTKNSKSYTYSGSYSFKGVDLNSDNNNSFADSLSKQFMSNEKAGTYSAPLPTRLILQGEYRIQGQTKKGISYNKHTFFFTYFQGFKDLGGATTRPALSTGYSLNLGRILNIGANAGIGGVNRFTLGAFTSLRLGGLTIGGGSGNILYLVSADNTTGADLVLNFGLNF